MNTEITRRGLLKGFFGIATVATIPAIPAVAHLNVDINDTATKYDHIVKAFEIFDSLVEDIVAFQKTSILVRPKDASIVINDKIDSLLNHCFATFEMPNSINLDDVRVTTRRIITTNTNSEYWNDFRNIPPVIVEAALPIYFMRVILGHHKFPLLNSHSTTWRQFSDTYQSLILYS